MHSYTCIRTHTHTHTHQLPYTMEKVTDRDMRTMLEHIRNPDRSAEDKIKQVTSSLRIGDKFLSVVQLKELLGGVPGEDRSTQAHIVLACWNRVSVPCM